MHKSGFVDFRDYFGHFSIKIAASYVLLFPFTLTFLAINLVLRSHYHFTVLPPGTSKISEKALPVISTRVEEGVPIYHCPGPIFGNYDLDRYLIYIHNEGEKRLIVVHKKLGSRGEDFDYVQVDEELIPTLVKILKEKSNNYICISGDPLQEILSGPINCEQLVRFLFETNAFFSLPPESLQVLLNIFQKRGLALNLRQQHPETKETLLHRYSCDAGILRALLSLDPALIQRIEGMQLNVVRILRGLGFGRRDELFMGEGPSIFGFNMDILEMRERLHDFLKHLRSQGLLLRQSEFAKLPSTNY